jgi:hydroxymethylglutaryl-CoA lyase
VPSEDVVYMLHRGGFETGIDLGKMIETSKWLATALGHEVPALLPKAGPFPA